MPADDYTDPAPATTFAHLDATTELSRDLASQGLYPAIDPLTSTSRILDPRYLGADHYRVAVATKAILPKVVILNTKALNCTLTMTSGKATVALAYTWTPEAYFAPITMKSTAITPILY